MRQDMKVWEMVGVSEIVFWSGYVCLGGVSAVSPDFDTENEAREWVRAEMAARGVTVDPKAVVDSTYPDMRKEAARIRSAAQVSR